MENKTQYKVILPSLKQDTASKIMEKIQTKWERACFEKLAADCYKKQFVPEDLHEQWEYLYKKLNTEQLKKKQKFEELWQFFNTNYLQWTNLKRGYTYQLAEIHRITKDIHIRKIKVINIDPSSHIDFKEENKDNIKRVRGLQLIRDHNQLTVFRHSS